MAASVFGIWRRCWSSPQWCYLHRLRTINTDRKVYSFTYKSQQTSGYFTLPMWGMYGRLLGRTSSIPTTLSKWSSSYI